MCFIPTEILTLRDIITHPQMLLKLMVVANCIHTSIILEIPTALSVAQLWKLCILCKFSRHLRLQQRCEHFLRDSPYTDANSSAYRADSSGGVGFSSGGNYSVANSYGILKYINIFYGYTSIFTINLDQADYWWLRSPIDFVNSSYCVRNDGDVKITEFSSSSYGVFKFL